MSKKLVVFDLDGTLNKTELYSVPAHKKALKELGITNITDEVIISTYGARYIDSAATLIGTSDPVCAKEYATKVGEYEREFIKEFHGSYDGVPEMLQKLKADGYLTAICSNSSERYIKMVLCALDIQKYIDYIQPLVPDMTKNETLSLLLEKVQPDDAIMVGDRVYDQMAAKANHLHFIGCLYGFCPEEVADATAPVTDALYIYDSVKALLG